MAKKLFSKRTLALLLALVMCFSTLQMTAWAEASDSQIMDGYYKLNTDGTIASEASSAEVTQNGFTVSKTIAPADGENQFNVTLEVITKQTITTNEAAIQLVIDISSSMNQCSINCQSHASMGQSCGKHPTRLDAVKDILIKDGGFLDSLTASNSGKVNVSVVTFGLNAYTICNWLDIKDPNNLTTVKNKINSLTRDTTENGTNMHAGLMLARNCLGMSDVANAASKFTVVLSDGEANCICSESSSTTRIDLYGRGPGSTAGTEAGKNNAAGMVTTLNGLSDVYTVGYGVDKNYLVGIFGESNADHIFVGTDAAAVSNAFSHIADSAIEGMNGAGSTVTDPMGKFVILDDVSGKAGVISAENVLTWELDPKNAYVNDSDPNEIIYTYTITYPITLNTSAEGFKEDTYYPTNGYTYLSAQTADGQTVEIPFNVPAVKGTIPEYNWSIKYYLQNESGRYDLDETEEKGAAKLHSTVNAPADYATKYNSENYVYASGDPSLVIGSGENVIELYYNRVMADVTVNHFYKTTTTQADGTVVVGEYPEDAQDTSTEFVWVGTEYTAVAQPVYNGATYTLDTVDPSTEVTVSTDGNIINFYYSREVDKRAITSARVDHIYNTYKYVLNADGKYELEETPSVSETKTVQEQPDLRATTTYEVTAKEPVPGYEDFVLNTDAGDYKALSENGWEFVLADDAEDNVRTLVFDYIDDNRVPAEVTVKHYYRTFTTVTIEKKDETGKVIGTTERTDTEVSEPVEVKTSGLYVGEKFVAETLVKEDYTFNAEASDAQTIDVVDGAVIELYYDRSKTADERSATKINVIHKYTTYLETIVDGKVDTITVKGEVTEHYPAEDEVLKAGDNFTAEAKPTYEGNNYTQITDDSALSVILQPEDNTIVIEYERNASDLVSVPYKAEYIYKTYTMTVNEDGVAGYWNDPDVETTVIEEDGYVGLQVTLPTGDKEDFDAADGNPATVQILAEEGNEWTFVFEKYVPLGDGSVTVNHHYKTTTIAENGTSSDASETVEGEPVTKYLGESYLAESIPEDFQLVKVTVDGVEVTAEESIQVVVGEDSVVDFYYEKTIDNSREVKYVVSHIYNLYTYDGELISSEMADPIVGSDYVTIEYTAVPAPVEGYELVSVTYNDAALEEPYTIALADGANEIVFVYEQYEPRAEVDVTVIHNYYESADKMDGKPVDVYEETVSGILEDSDYTAKKRIVDGYEFYSATPASMKITATKDGENVIVINYVEEEPPLAEVPKTGDATVIYATLTTLSGVGLATLGLKKKKESDEEE